MKHLGTKCLETERLILRRFRLDDAKAMYHNWASDDEVTKYLTWPSHKDVASSEEILKEWVESYENADNYNWAITLKESVDNPIGSMGVVNPINDIAKAHIGYCIGRKWWHKGITSEALKRIMEYLFDEVGLNRVESRHDPRNMFSGEVMKKCGMKYEGTLRQADRNNMGICDASYYGLLVSEWRN